MVAVQKAELQSSSLPTGDKKFCFSLDVSCRTKYQSSLLPDVTSITHLEGAVTGIFRELHQSSWHSLTLDKSTDSATLDNLPVGTVYAKETTAPKGFLLDQSVHAVNNKPGRGTLTVTDTPIEA